MFKYKLLKKKLKVKINLFDVIVKTSICITYNDNIVVFIYMNVYNYTMSNGIACLISYIIRCNYIYAILLFYLEYLNIVI